ncbi:hypothetical protein P3T76_012076 [Phytophthora citrophthora]|uniref:Uncharacterized protein n=1 Tax=Phytophthora citrophthora TaxID=4793 RepID=A0AAD9G612_9STRA|nr:hypothetical protein P3T76_012076 [Phytophthora citrophthora]
MSKRKEREYPFRHSISELFDKSEHQQSAASLRSNFGFGIDRLFLFVKALRNLIPDASDHRARNVLHRLSERLVDPLLSVTDLI